MDGGVHRQAGRQAERLRRNTRYVSSASPRVDAGEGAFKNNDVGARLHALTCTL